MLFQNVALFFCLLAPVVLALGSPMGHERKRHHSRRQRVPLHTVVDITADSGRQPSAPNDHTVIAGGSLCKICQFAANYIQGELNDTTIDAEIESILKQICTVAPSSYESICDMFVVSYGDAMIAYLVHEFDPETICPAMYLCQTVDKSDAEVMLPLPATVITVNAGGRSGPENCPTCLFTVSQALDAVKSDKSKSNIKHMLSLLCNHLPAKMQLECADFVETYTNELVNMLANDFTPAAICAQLSLCDTKKEKKPYFSDAIYGAKDFMLLKSNKIPDGDSNFCDVCQTVMTQLEDVLNDKETQQEILDFMMAICHSLPQALDDQCTSVINTYAPMIIGMIVSTPPNVICGQLNLCAPSESKFEVDCAVCRLATQEIRRVLDNPDTKGSIEHVMKHTCAKLLGKEFNQCVKLMRVYGHSMMNKIYRRNSEVHTVCSHIGICSADENSPFA